MCPTISRSDRRIHAESFAGFSARMKAISCQSRNRAVIRLDSRRGLTDTLGNTPAASLLDLVLCHFSDVHKGRVFTEHIARVELQRITAAPPLVISNGQHAYLGRLLFCFYRISLLNSVEIL